MRIFTASVAILCLMLLRQFVAAEEYCKEGNLVEEQPFCPWIDDEVGRFVIDGATCEGRKDALKAELEIAKRWVIEAANKISQYKGDGNENIGELLRTPAMYKFLPEYYQQLPGRAMKKAGGLMDIVQLAEDFRDSTKGKPKIKILCGRRRGCDPGTEAYYSKLDDYINLCEPFWHKADSDKVSCEPVRNLDQFDCKARAIIHELLHSDCYEDRQDQPDWWPDTAKKAYFTRCCWLLAHGEGWSGKNDNEWRLKANENADNGAWIVTAYHFDQKCSTVYPDGIPAEDTGCRILEGGPKPRPPSSMNNQDTEWLLPYGSEL